MTFFQLLLLSAILMLNQSLAQESTKLLLLQTLFRHGDRAPLYIYPTDPNNPRTCWPMGLGKLTQLGKMQHYAVGTYLRSRYKDFITTNPIEVYANSSEEERCLTSALSNLAAFYAPSEEWRIQEDLNWQPIPVHYLPWELDTYLNWDIPCPRAQQEDNILLRGKAMQSLYQEYQNLIRNVSMYSGADYTEGAMPLYLYDTLLVEKIHNLIIPDWADSFWDGMELLSSAVFHTFIGSDIQIKLRVGPFLQLLGQNINEKINGINPNLKVVMNSAHDMNVAAVLQALNFTYMPRPPYCATLLIELHEMSDASMAVRLLYLNSTDPLTDVGDPHVLVMYDCTEFCPVDKFINSFQRFIPDDWVEECQFQPRHTDIP